MCMDSLVRVSRRVIWYLAGQHNEESRSADATSRAKPSMDEFTPFPQHRTEESSRPIKAVDVRVRIYGCVPKRAIRRAYDLAHTRVGRHQGMELHTKNPKWTSVVEQSLSRAQGQYACIATVSGTFNSLSKVLCTFPSRYLFAIGLELVLSFRWNVPPNLRCRPRQHDSESTDRTQLLSDVRRDSHPLLHPLPRDLHLRSYWNRI